MATTTRCKWGFMAYERWSFWALLLAIVAAPLAGVADAGQFVFLKPELTVEQYQSDAAKCVSLAKSWPADPVTGLPNPVGGAQPITPHVYAGLLPELLLQHDARSQLIKGCMRQHGYVRVALTDTEARSYSDAGGTDAQAAWLVRLSTSQDIDGRLSDALAQQPMALPLAAREPFVIGAIRIDPRTLVSQGPALEGQPILTGQVFHRRTAKLALGFDLYSAQVDPGTEFIEFVPPTGWSSDLSPGLTAWCAQVGGRPTAVGELQQFTKTLPGPIVLDVQPNDELGPLDFSLVVEKLTDTRVTLAAEVRHDGKAAIVWRGAEVFDPSGHTVLPFWTRRLLLAKQGTTLAATFDERGDGRGWADQN